MSFKDFFSTATGGKQPYPYQESLATSPQLPQLLCIPTGVGKTAATVLGWLYRRFGPDKELGKETPLRLIYCLPMRTLVEQTFRACNLWLDRLSLSEKVGIHVLMGGEDAGGWDTRPDRECMIIGTQDMLLSRALNRGYGMSRYRWPMHFGLLNNDCLWVLDETQLMGAGLPTTAQLQGLRAKLGTCGPIHTLWMSATLDTRAIDTVDHRSPVDGFSEITLGSADHDDPAVKRRLAAVKVLEPCPCILADGSAKKGYAPKLAEWLVLRHRPGSLTLVVVNRVARAQEIFKELRSLHGPKTKPVPLQAEIGLIHSRFRPDDRIVQQRYLDLTDMPEAGRIVVATQAIEAGVDISASLLVTELAPWPSLVQRFGRCNRAGEFPQAEVYWVDIHTEDEKATRPYTPQQLDASRSLLEKLSDVGPEAIGKVDWDMPEPVGHILRRKDLLDLWDTTPDLAGNDLDISRFIRDASDTDVQVFWRRSPGESATDVDVPAPTRGELCSVGIQQIREFLTGHKKKGGLSARVWRPLESAWTLVEPSEVHPGMVLLLPHSLGGYSAEIGWTGNPLDLPSLPTVADEDLPEDLADGMNIRAGEWVPLRRHLDDVHSAMQALSERLSVRMPEFPWAAMLTAARWHDVGKAHPAFQNMLRRRRSDLPESGQLFAKSPGGMNGRPRYFANDAETDERPGFRHELASVIAWLIHNPDSEHADLVAFIIGAHHGKIRGSIRSLPGEISPVDPGRRFARGIFEGDVLPAVSIDEETELPSLVLDLGLMEVGESECFGPSWISRVTRLRDSLKAGPFRLSFMETLLRVADWRASVVEGASDGT
jgi:CRISPR-associated endonuclease/helicase Cas3